MALTRITISLDEMVRARLIQAALKDERSVSAMCSRLLDLGLKEFWKGFEPKIENAGDYIETHTAKDVE